MSTGQVYWLISAPVPEHAEKDKILDSVQRKLHGLASCFSFVFPINQLRFGTLDALMSLSDDLVKFDLVVENVTRKIASQLYSLFDPKEHPKLLSVNGASPELYLTHFKWDEAKYPIKSTCRELTEIINSQVNKLDEELRVKAGEYSTTSMSITQSDRQQTGNLVSKDLSEIIKQEHWMQSEYLTTLYVAVPKHSASDWENIYESLTTHVLPRSSKLITSDSEYNLYSVTLFKRDVDEFKTKAREKRFTVRDFQYDPTKIEKSKKDKEVLKATRETQKNKLVLWCKTNFAEAFIAWIHLKAIRVFVESILRYGLPPHFQTVLAQPQKGSDRKARVGLTELFKNLGSKHLEASEDEQGSEAFFPYVSLTINIEMKTS